MIWEALKVSILGCGTAGALWGAWLAGPVYLMITGVFIMLFAMAADRDTRR